MNNIGDILDKNLKTININEIKYFIGEWGSNAVKQFEQMYMKYGTPDEYTPTMLIWNNNGDWVKTVLYKQPVLHNFPKAHYDVLEQCIYYRVPLCKFDDIADFDGSIWAERTKGLLTTICHYEAMNYVSINLAHAVINDTLTISQARQEFMQLYVDVIEDGNTPLISQQFSFNPFTPELARDPDVQTI